MVRWPEKLKLSRPSTSQAAEEPPQTISDTSHPNKINNLVSRSLSFPENDLDTRVESPVPLSRLSSTSPISPPPPMTIDFADHITAMDVAAIEEVHRLLWTVPSFPVAMPEASPVLAFSMSEAGADPWRRESLPQRQLPKVERGEKAVSWGEAGMEQKREAGNKEREPVQRKREGSAWARTWSRLQKKEKK